MLPTLILAETAAPNPSSMTVLDNGHGHVIRRPHGPEDVLVPIAAFAFVICILFIAHYFRMKRRQMWHDTARLALEKGQPLPAALSDEYCGRGRRLIWFRGLVWMAVGLGLHFVHNGGISRWAPIPLCVGAAMVLGGAIAHFLQSKEQNTPNPS